MTFLWFRTQIVHCNFIIMFGCRSNTKKITLCLLFLLTTSVYSTSLVLGLHLSPIMSSAAVTFKFLLFASYVQPAAAGCGAGQYEECIPGIFYGYYCYCYYCSKGRYQNQNWHSEVSCKACPQGYYTHHTGDWECYKCGAGRYQPKTAQVSVSSCLNCPAGTKQPNTAQTSLSSCQSCPTGARSYEGSRYCYYCYYGKAFVAKNEECRGCTPGKFQPLKNVPSAACQPCGVGKRSSKIEQSSSCDDCQLGRIQPDSGKDYCSECENGKKYISAVSCIDCVAGTFSERESQSIVRVCSDCEVGTYSDQAATFPSCTPCISGKYG